MANYINRQKPNSGLANFLANKGRFGDTELVHMTRPELKRLENTGLMTLNPQTGLPEMFLGSIFKGIKSYAKNMIKPKNFIPALASMAMPAMFGAMANATSLGKLLGSSAVNSILKGSGTFLGNLPFRGLEGSAQAGVTHGVVDYGLGQLRNMIQPGPAAYDLTGEGKKLSLAQLDAIRSRVGADGLGTLPESRTPGPEGDGYVDFANDIPESMQPYLGSGNLSNRQVATFNKAFSALPVEKQQRLTGWGIAEPDAARTHIANQLDGVINPNEVKMFQSGVFGADEASQRQALNNYLRDKRLLGTPKMKAQALDPWNTFKNTGLDQLMSGDIKDGLQTLPVGEMAKTIAGSVEATSLTDVLKEQDDFEREQRRRLEESQFAGYSPSRSNVSYYTRRLANPPGSVPTRRVEQGGLIGLAYGGNPKRDFEGMVRGGGHGMQDNVIMDIKQKGGLLAVSPKEYVVPADVMSMLGNGNPDNGAKQMDGFISDFRTKKYGRDRQPPEMNGRTALQSLLA